MAECSVDGCDKPHSANGMCAMHNSRVWRTGTTETARRRNQCSVDGCENWCESHGYCAMHWRRVRMYGSPDVVLKGGKPRSTAPTQRKNGYWVIYAPEHPTASTNGQTFVHRMNLYDSIGPGTHRCHRCGRKVTWFAERPARLDVDHADGDRSNNDPRNLRPSCHKCNDGQAKRRKPSCARGHIYTPETTYISPQGHRRCRICWRENARAQRQR